MAKDSGAETQQPFWRKQYEIRHRALEGAMQVRTPKFFLINFYLSIVALQCCVIFCCTEKWIHCMYTYIPSFVDFLPIWRRQWQPTPVFLPGKSHERRSLVGCSPWGCWESDTTERLHFPFSLSCIGEGNGNPLQCSCLESPRDGGAWWAASMGSRSRTRLKWLSRSSRALSQVPCAMQQVLTSDLFYA